MVVNVPLALPQFSSTLVWQLILKHNNLELMLGRVTLHVGGEGLSCSSCTISRGAPQYLWMSVELCDGFHSPISSNSLSVTCCTPRVKVQASYVKFPCVTFPRRWH